MTAGPLRARAWAELLRVSALPSVPGDALAGAAAAGLRPGGRTAWAVGASLCLYEAGMALNDWADRHVDAVERPHRPLPSGRVTPAEALGAAGLLTATGLALAARAGRPALTIASALAATVWAYDLRLKHTAAGPPAMAAARALDLLLGAAATPHTPRERVTALRAAAPAALALAAHTGAVTAVSRHETDGGSTTTPLAALATTLLLATATARSRSDRAPAPSAPPRTDTAAGTPSDSSRTGSAPTPSRAGSAPTPPRTGSASAASRTRPSRTGSAPDPVTVLLAAAYLRTAARPLLHAALNPSPPLTQRAVGGGIRAMIPLQAALIARSGAPLRGLALLGLAPAARRLARKVSPT